jgi:hypothetical protein
MSDEQRKFETGQFVSLKEYISFTITPIEREVNNVRSAIEKLTVSQISAHDLDGLKLQVASLSEALQELEKRVSLLEQHDNVSTWIFRSVVGIGTALLIGYLSTLLR